MKRREFIMLLGSAAATWPPAAHAQQPAMPVIGLLNSTSADEYASRIAAFRQGLSETGYVEGRNVAIEYRWAESQYDRLPEMAADLVRRQVAVIVAITTPAAFAAKAATTAIPIVFEMGGDPVALGLIASLSRPGGNPTGVSLLNADLVAKRLELLHELAPTATVAAVLVNPTAPLAETQSRQAQVAAGTLGLQLHVLHASTERDFDTVFATLLKLKASEDRDHSGLAVLGNLREGALARATEFADTTRMKVRHGVAQHVRMNLERKTRFLPCSLHQPVEAVRREWSATFGHKHKR